MLDPWNHPAVWHAINVHLPIVLALLGLPLVCVLAITGILLPPTTGQPASIGASRKMVWPSGTHVAASIRLTRHIAESYYQRRIPCCPSRA